MSERGVTVGSGGPGLRFSSQADLRTYLGVKRELAARRVIGATTPHHRAYAEGEVRAYEDALRAVAGLKSGGG